MALEIERKFLAKNDEWRSHVTKSTNIVQGYLVSDPKTTIRVRIQDNSSAVLCIKGQARGISTPEYELPIPDLEEAQHLLGMCELAVLTKVRHLVPLGEHTFEVDEFTDFLQGLIVIEVELTRENEDFPHPDWLGLEVTHDIRYKNALLVRDGLPT
jgi:adenylate cyclase